MTEFRKLLANEAVLVEVGRRLAETRLALNLSQAKCARDSGVSTSTVERVEHGRSIQLGSFIAILRTLSLLDNLDKLFPKHDGFSPMQRLREEQRSKKRTKTSSKRKAPKSA
ncbi:MAG: helix-turn-helix transcriptional regulator [Nannocystaceae bacterium]